MAQSILEPQLSARGPSRPPWCHWLIPHLSRPAGNMTAASAVPKQGPGTSKRPSSDRGESDPCLACKAAYLWPKAVGAAGVCLMPAAADVPGRAKKKDI